MENKRNVRGLILCGGLGKRLMPLTMELPKPLVEIRRGFTILDKQLLDLKEADIKKAFLLVGYLGDKIKERYKDRWNDIEIGYFAEEQPMGTLWAIKNALANIKQEGDVVVRNGDIVSDFSIRKFAETSKASPYLLTLAVTKMLSPYGVLKLDGDKITDFVEKPLLDLYINAGIYYIKKDGFPYFFENYSEKDVEKTVFPKLTKEGRTGYYYEDVFWESVDTIKDLERVRREFEKRQNQN